MNQRNKSLFVIFLKMYTFLSFHLKHDDFYALANNLSMFSLIHVLKEITCLAKLHHKITRTMFFMLKHGMSQYHYINFFFPLSKEITHLKKTKKHKHLPLYRTVIPNRRTVSLKGIASKPSKKA